MKKVKIILVGGVLILITTLSSISILVGVSSNIHKTILEFSENKDFQKPFITTITIPTPSNL